jgi:NADH:ubiquinone oxidoreductase subunit 6 (subunit J)
MSSFALYLFGFLLIIGGLAYGAYLLGAPQLWIIIGAVILLGLAFTTTPYRAGSRDIRSNRPDGRLTSP